MNLVSLLFIILKFSRSIFDFESLLQQWKLVGQKSSSRYFIDSGFQTKKAENEKIESQKIVFFLRFYYIIIRRSFIQCDCWLFDECRGLCSRRKNIFVWFSIVSAGNRAKSLTIQDSDFQKVTEYGLKKFFFRTVFFSFWFEQFSFFSLILISSGENKKFIS